MERKPKPSSSSKFHNERATQSMTTEPIGPVTQTMSHSMAAEDSSLRATVGMSNEIGIYIICHGILEEKIIRSPPKVTIIKQNLGGYGCTSYHNKIHRESNETIALSLTSNMDIALTSKQYQACEQHKTMTNEQGEFVDTHGHVIDKTNSCERFEGLQYWVLKQYKRDPRKVMGIYIAFHGKVCDLFTISFEEFCQLFELDKMSEEDYARLKSHFDYRTKKDKIYNTVIFEIIHIMYKIHKCTIARILDESCNVYIDTSKKQTFTHVTKGQIEDYLPKPKDQVLEEHPRRSDVGYGGQKTKRNIKKSKKYKKK
jgi:hypothetical protein